MALPEHLKIGARGEQLAARYLRRQGYQIYTANYATSQGETDIIVIDRDGTVCFVEVKTRSPGGMLPPAEAVDQEKRRRLSNNAAAFLAQTKMQGRKTRFDIVEVILYDLFTADFNHIKDAFEDGLPGGD